MIEPELCNRCRRYSGLKELCRVKPERPISYKSDCIEGKTELRTKIFEFLFNMKKGARVQIMNDEQRLHVYEFVRLHGYDEGIELSSDWNTIKKHKF